MHRDAFRTFLTTPRCLASEVPDDFINSIKHTLLFQKLADKLNALKVLGFVCIDQDDGYGTSFPIAVPRWVLTRLTTSPPLSFEGLNINSKTDV